MEYKSEAHLQNICYKNFLQLYPNQLYRLFLIYNNPPNAVVGSMLKSMGLKKGVADYLYFAPDNITHVWIECKIGNSDQSDWQQKFQNLVESHRDHYRMAWNEIQFLEIIKEYN